MHYRSKEVSRFRSLRGMSAQEADFVGVPFSLVVESSRHNGAGTGQLDAPAGHGGRRHNADPARSLRSDDHLHRNCFLVEDGSGGALNFRPSLASRDTWNFAECCRWATVPQGRQKSDVYQCFFAISKKQGKPGLYIRTH